MTVWLAEDSAPVKLRFYAFLAIPMQNILSPPSHKGGTFDKGEDVFLGKVRAQRESHTNGFHERKQQVRAL